MIAHFKWWTLVCFAFSPCLRLAGADEWQIRRPEVRVGVVGDAAWQYDFRGNDNRVLQAAVDYVGQLGGGTVHIGPGRYTMRNALRLRDNVEIVGTAGETILVACDGFVSPLAADGDANERQITVADASGFRLGDGVSIQDRDAGGFGVTTATLTAQTGPATFQISAPLYFDYMVAKKATARLTFPVVGGWQIKNARVEDISIDGNRDKAQELNGCRGAGIYLFECGHVTIRNCTVRSYAGDGISFQVSHHVTVEDCVLENHSGLGLHPGSGSTHPIVRRNRSIGNGGDGLFVCWRVKHGLFEENEIRGNRRVGISIGHKDTDNLFRNNTVVGNAGAGVLFRKESEAMGAHRNVFEGNRIVDNAAGGQNSGAAIVIDGPHHDLVFKGNTIGNSKAGSGPGVGIQVSEEAHNLQADDKQFVNVEKNIDRKK